MQIFAMQIMFKICVSYHNDRVYIETTEDHRIIFESMNNGLTRLDSNTYKLDLCIKRHKGSMKISSTSDNRTLLLIPFRADESLHLRAKCNAELKVKKDGEIIIDGNYGKSIEDLPSDEFASDFSFSSSSSDSSSDDEHSNSDSSHAHELCMNCFAVNERSELRSKLHHSDSSSDSHRDEEDDEEEDEEEEYESNHDSHDSYGNPYDQYSDIEFEYEEEEEDDEDEIE